VPCCVRRRTHIFVVLLEVDELLLQGLDLALQVHAAHVGVVDELPQTHDVGVHGLADGQLGLKPRGRGIQGYRQSKFDAHLE